LVSGVALSLVLSGCGTETSETAETAKDQPRTTTSTKAADAGRSEASGGTVDLLSFTAPAIGGGQVDGSTFQGRPTLLWFWSPW
jgi:hypothetical protein